MKIYREVNGTLIDFELTHDEIVEAYTVLEAEFDFDDAQDEIERQCKDDQQYPDEFVAFVMEDGNFDRLGEAVSNRYRGDYTWCDAGVDQMIRATSEILDEEYKLWRQNQQEQETAPPELESTPPIPNKPYAEYHITMKQEDEDCFHELRTALERAEFPVSDWYEEDGVIHLNDVFTADANSSNYLLTLIRCYATMSNVTITVMELLPREWTPQKIIFNGGMMERYIANVTYTKI